MSFVVAELVRVSVGRGLPKPRDAKGHMADHRAGRAAALVLSRAWLRRRCGVSREAVDSRREVTRLWRRLPEICLILLLFPSSSRLLFHLSTVSPQLHRFVILYPKSPFPARYAFYSEPGPPRLVFRHPAFSVLSIIRRKVGNG